MTLRTWYIGHAAVTIPFALPMVIAPGWFLELLVDMEPTDLAVAMSRLVGAAYLLITFLTVAAALWLHDRAQIIVARVFCLYEGIGAIVGTTIDFPAHRDVARWLTIGFFSVYCTGYLWFGFLAPALRRREGSGGATA